MGIYGTVNGVVSVKSCSPLYFRLQLEISLNLKKTIESYRMPKGKGQCIEHYGNYYSNAYQILSRSECSYNRGISCMRKVHVLVYHRCIEGGGQGVWIPQKETLLYVSLKILEGTSHREAIGPLRTNSFSREVLTALCEKR